MCRAGGAADTLPMMPHNGSACQLEVPHWHLKFEVANCNLKVLGHPHLFEIAICDLKDSASSGDNRNMKIVLAAAYAAHPERFTGGSPAAGGPHGSLDQPTQYPGALARSFEYAASTRPSDLPTRAPSRSLPSIAAQSQRS